MAPLFYLSYLAELREKRIVFLGLVLFRSWASNRIHINFLGRGGSKVQKARSLLRCLAMFIFPQNTTGGITAAGV